MGRPKKNTTGLQNQTPKQKRQGQALQEQAFGSGTLHDIAQTEAAAKTAESQQRAAELQSYGIDTSDPVVKAKASLKGGIKYTGGVSESDLSEGRGKALRVSQREQLRAQNQELKTLDLQGKRRRRGRGSLLSYVSSQKNTLGPSGSLQ